MVARSKMAPPDRLKGAISSLVWLAAFVVPLAVAGQPASAEPAPASPGCASLTFSGETYVGTGVVNQHFFAGERVLATALIPESGSTTATSFQLQVNGSPVGTAPLAETVSYTFPVNAVASVAWSTNGGAAIWVVQCARPALPSPGCSALNASALDAQYTAKVIPASRFFAGERVTAAAGPPTGPPRPPSRVLLVVNRLVDSTPFPGTVAYTFPADASVPVIWSVDAGSARWTVTCTPPLVSPGCAGANHPGIDAQYGGASTGLNHYFAGDRLTLSAGPPIAGAPPTTVSLFVDRNKVVTTTLVASAPFPGTVSYLFPTDGTYAVDWRVDATIGATWRVSCSPGRTS